MQKWKTSAASGEWTVSPKGLNDRGQVIGGSSLAVNPGACFLSVLLHPEHLCHNRNLQMRKVGFVLPRFHPYQGGYENSILAIARRLVARGNRVEVFTTDALDLEAFWLKGHRMLPSGPDHIDEIVVNRFPIDYGRWKRRASRLLGFFPRWELQSQFARPSFHVIGLASALKAAALDVIHVGPLPYNSLIYSGLREGMRRRIPVLVTPCVHFGEDSNSEVSRYYTQSFQIELLNRCDKVLTMTETETHKLAELGVDSKKLATTAHPVDIAGSTGGDGQRFRGQHRITGPIVLHLGMRAFEKGSRTVLEATKILWQKGEKAWLVFAGPGMASFDEYLEQQSADCDKLLKLGPVSDAVKRDVLAAATVVVQPSRVESLGLVILEAWANRKPPIAADIPVSRELVQSGKNGFLVPFGDSGATAAAMAKLLSDPELCRSMGAEGQRKVLDQYEAELVLSRIECQFSACG
jgi:glycogen synthase